MTYEVSCDQPRYQEDIRIPAFEATMKVCPTCQNHFVPGKRQPKQVYCSRICRRVPERAAQRAARLGND